MQNYKVIIIIALCSLIVGLFYLIKLNKTESFKSTITSEPEDELLLSNKQSYSSEPSNVETGPEPSDPYITQPKELSVEHSEGANMSNDCFPKAHMNPTDLLPSSEVTEWSHANPTGKGNLEDQNFLNAGYHVGINTIGQSLRNANMQIRSEPPNPQKKVGPWMQTTIEPDLERKPLEIQAEC